MSDRFNTFEVHCYLSFNDYHRFLFFNVLIGDCPILLVWWMDLDDIRPQCNEIEERIWKVH